MAVAERVEVQRKVEAQEPKVQFDQVELVRPETPKKSSHFVGWAKKGKDSTCCGG